MFWAGMTLSVLSEQLSPAAEIFPHVLRISFCLMQVFVTAAFCKAGGGGDALCSSLRRNTLHCLPASCWRLWAELGPLSDLWCWNVPLQRSSLRLRFHNEAVRSDPCLSADLRLLTWAGTRACRGSCYRRENTPDGLPVVQALSAGSQVIVGS